MKQAYVVALLLVLVALGMEALVTPSQVGASKIPSTLNRAKSAIQLPQGSGTAGIQDQVVLQAHVSVVLCRKSNSVGSALLICEETP
jgi:ABC-type phosphate transport system ATPase subunit